MRAADRVVAAALTVGLLTGCAGVGATPPFRHLHPIQVSSAAFSDRGPIPTRFTCLGTGEPPPISWQNLPAHTVTVAVVVVDEDAPRHDFVHWVVFDVPASATGLVAAPPAGSRQGRNSAGTVGWVPPCPRHGLHHYFFTVYAFRVRLSLPNGAGTGPALRVLQLRSVGRGTIVGTVQA